MYGLVNKAVEGLVRTKFGDAMWDRIRSDAGLPDEPFVSMAQYPDATTYALVGAATKALGVDAAAILREFGRYWMQYTAEAGYGDLLRTAGRTLPEFLRNLDQLHTRVQLMFPHLQPPSFAVTDEADGALVLHYHSDRPGLAPLVEGLLDGLSRRFGVALTVRHERIEAGKPHDRFHLRWTPTQATA